MNSNRIFGLPDAPTSDNDATSKKYVDTSVTTATTNMATTTYVNTALGINGTMLNSPSVYRNDNHSGYVYLAGVGVSGSNPPPIADGVTGRCNLYIDYNLLYVPNTNTLYATTFGGALNGNASSATWANRAENNTPFRIGNSNTTDPDLMQTSTKGTVSLIVRPLSNGQSYRPNYGWTSYAMGADYLSTNGLGYGVNGYIAASGLTTFGSFFVAFFEGIIQCGCVIAGSDKRMKQNISEITDGTSSLQLLRRIKSSTFEYIDKYMNSPYRVHGFIAQDIKDIVPEAVYLVPDDCLPSFYCMCSIEKCLIQENDKTETFRVYIPVNNVKKLIFTGNHDKKTGIEYKTASGAPASDASGNQNFKVKMKDSSDNDVEVITTQIIDDFSFLVKVKLNDKGENTVIKEDTYFLYGQYVDDFHKIDTEHIHNIATAALQEVDRQQQADKIRIAELEATVANQQSLINDILERLKTLEKA